MVQTDSGPSVTNDGGTGIVTLSIVNYMIYNSNGRAFEWAAGDGGGSR